MRRFSQDFTGLGLLINVLVVIGFVVPVGCVERSVVFC